MKIVSSVGYALRRVPVESEVCKSMMFSNVIVDITISRHSFVFGQSCVEVPANLSDVGGLAVGALNLVNRWFTNLEQTPLNRCQQLSAPYKRLIHDINITYEPNRTV